MKMIVSLLGSPSKELLKRCNSDQIQHFLRGLGQHTPVSLRKVFPDASEEALDLLDKILVLDPGVSWSIIRGAKGMWAGFRVPGLHQRGRIP